MAVLLSNVQGHKCMHLRFVRFADVQFLRFNKSKLSGMNDRHLFSNEKLQLKLIRKGLLKNHFSLFSLLECAGHSLLSLRVHMVLSVE